ncbi:MAG: phospho-N-acetylmuramoyl-pentapeptide-transferase [Micrococcales bacterium]|nr:phospho-N-acetylmuramoyl-pentapeptide-transferase [Micrococcales bacterium]NBR60337.1 phospho-N-acetylmuramoyl-pentapeptide-transferase [Actinomycetota bacterium]NBR54400.1 phospho-N-acetylmuramoyl-pentapeptide-transferase [Micrococcales bacterium]NBT46235.1 phospho-N-acetylmuramoyl-pentapeptide-transferase [Actinomycetota bacterium]NBY43507.1 phospho-N-acetylmuramoyl-pentapeptide-transferase [Micrococcales bacterium]
MRALLLAGFLGLVLVLILTPTLIWLFRKLQWGQVIRVDGPNSHQTKRGTPNMGGIAIILSSVTGYFLAKAINGETPTSSALLIIFMMIGLGSVGFLDDFLKVRKQNSAGLPGVFKILGQLVVSGIFAFIAIRTTDGFGFTSASTEISIFRDTGFDLMKIAPSSWGEISIWIGGLVFLLWICLIVTSASNGVNLTDGLDGLATGSLVMSIGAFAVIGFWKFNQACDLTNVAPNCYQTSNPLDLAVVAAGIVGSLIGFLWFNTNPAQIFMGDSGSLGLGGALAALAILSRTEILLVLVGGLYAIEAGSVILQRGVYKITKWTTGRPKRIILMSPLHHHFEEKGWNEVTVVVRFWIICGLLVLAGIGLFYVEWIYGSVA